MIVCYLALGSNLKSPQRQLRRAIDAIRRLPSTEITHIARFYPSKAWGRKVQPSFYNTAVAIRTSLTPEMLLTKCQQIETRQGRCRRIKWGARTLDIDILLYGTRQIKKPKLTIPHPYLLERDFVLIPLLEIAPDLAMPNGYKISQVIKNVISHVIM